MKNKKNITTKLSTDVKLRSSYLSLASNEGIWDLYLPTQVVYYNDQMYQLFGYSHEEMADNNFWWQNNIHPEESENVLKAFNELLDGTSTKWQGFYRFKTKSGEYIPVFERIYVVRGRENEPLRLVGSMMDTTSLNKAEEELEENEKKLKKQILKNVIESDQVEKKKISFELNENINQVLAAVNLKIDLLKQFIEKTKISQIDEVKELLNDSISDIRTINRKLYPTGINRLGLQPILEDELRYFKKNTGINFSLSIDKKIGNINKDYLLIIYHVILDKLESLSELKNALNVSIFIRCFKNKTLMSITDDGKYTQALFGDLNERFSKAKLLADVYDFRLEITLLKNGGSELEFEI